MKLNQILGEGLAGRERKRREQRDMAKVKFAPFLTEDFLGMMRDIHSDVVNHYDVQYRGMSFEEWMGQASERFLNSWIESYITGYVHEEILTGVRKQYPEPADGGITYRNG
jgi:hypothetical protein